MQYLSKHRLDLFFKEIDTLILKFIWKCNKHKQNNQNSLKKNKVRLPLPYFKNFYKATVIKTAKYQCKSKHTDQWNKNESPEVNLYI